MFSDNDRKNAILGSVGILSLIIACAASIQLYKLVVPEHVERNTINITRDDYEQALAKWRARGVAEYEITIERHQDEFTLRVTNRGATVQVLQQLHRGRPVSAENMPTDPFPLQQVTVEWLFDLVRDSLDFILSGTIPPPHGALDYYYDYEIWLDRGLGYPTHIAMYSRSARQSKEVIWRESLQPSIEVKGLKVLR